MSAPTPPPGATPQAGQSFNFNIAKWNIFDKIALGAGVLFFIFSLLNGFIHASVKSQTFMGETYGGGSQTNGTAWHSWGWIAVLLVLAAVILVALKAVDGIVPPTVPMPLVVAGAAGLGWLLLVIRAFTGGGYPNPAGSGVSVSPGWSAWVLFIIGLAIVAAVVIPLTSAAGSVEAKLNNAAGSFGGQNNGGNNTQPPAAGGSSEFPPPPAN